MNADNFTQFLKSSAQLYHLPYVELESLVLEFPYAQNLRLLLFAKSWLEQHPQADANLRKAALYSTDRSMLYRYVQELSAQLTAQASHVLLQEDYLELSELTRLPSMEELVLQEDPAVPPLALPATSQEDDLEIPAFSPRKKVSKPAPFDPEKVREQLAQLFQMEDSPQVQANSPEEGASVDTDETPLQPQVADTPTTPARQDPAWKFSFTDALQRKLTEKLEQLRQTQSGRKPAGAPLAISPGADSVAMGQPLPKSAFHTWQLSASQVQERLEALRSALDLPEILQNNDPVDVIAHQSIRENLHLASETLANLLLRQGQREKAIEVYERLMLLFPEKTPFFAAKIESIKNLEP